MLPRRQLLSLVRSANAATTTVRHLSSSTTTASAPSSGLTTSLKLAAALATLGLGAAYVTDARAAVHPLLTMPLMRTFVDPESSHVLAVKMAKAGLAPRDRKPDPDCLATDLWGMTIANPVGLAAGFDKNAECIDGMLDMGFGMVEIGSVTPKPQPGNPKPRVFRLTDDGAVINRYGFNSDGHATVLQRLLHRVRAHAYRDAAAPSRAALRDGRLLGINLGKNKSSAVDSPADYVTGVRTFAALADYLVINVSSPNTPGLRSMQRREVLTDLMHAVVRERNAVAADTLGGRKVPVCVKIAPDMSEEELKDVAAAAMEAGIDGLIVANTTVQRPAGLKSDDELVSQMGGLSGKPVLPLGLRAVGIVRQAVGDQLPIIGCGGISTAADALAYARAGARCVQLYTSMSLSGPGVVPSVKDGVAEYLQRHGLKWSDVVGADERGAALPAL
ncbi:hypothetical protein BC828DRAFT_386209 [Blastocladiella britannica]|nr:hypothetical protein BC828DRAFT_386209 [Blastocladiella britannica]